MNNNPLRYLDPTGHRPCGDKDVINCSGKLNNPRIIQNGDCGNVGQKRCDGKPPTYGNGLIGPAKPNGPYVTTVPIGGVNPASAPGTSDDDGVPVITNITGTVAFGVPTIISIVSPLIQQSSGTPDTSVWLSYSTSDDGSVDNMVITINNQNGNSAVNLTGVGIQTESNVNPATSEYLPDLHPNLINPGQVEHTAICNNCIADNVLTSDETTFPIDRYSQINVSVNIGAYYNYGLAGTAYGQMPIMYTIPSR